MSESLIYQPKLTAGRALRIQESLARIYDFWKAVDYRITRDTAPLHYDLEKLNISHHWLEMASRFTAVELDEIRGEIIRSYGDPPSENVVLQPLDRNTSQGVLAAKNLFEAATSGHGRMNCPQFGESMSFPDLRRYLMQTLDSVQRKIEIYIEANSLAKK